MLISTHTHKNYHRFTEGAEGSCCGVSDAQGTTGGVPAGEETPGGATR